jgi:hypothetical protein
MPLRLGLLSSLLLGASLVYSGCASGGDPGPGGGDADGAVGTDSGSDDAGGTGMPDSGRMRDSGPPSCGAGEHLCGSRCEPDRMNDPANGCTNGCGTAACPAPELGIAACSTTGDCTWDCMPPYVREGDVCTCAPRTCTDAMAECGPLDDGCGGTTDCGLCSGGRSCTGNICGCMPDATEPNDVRTAISSIATLEDCSDDARSILDLNIDEMADEDWYRFDISDCFDAGNPQITVTLDGIAGASDYDLAAYYACPSGNDSSCTRGTIDNTVGNGCASVTAGSAVETVEIATECSGTDDSGILFIHVTARTWAMTCDPYRIQIDVR